MTETISIILNFILGSGLLGTLIFFKPKQRKEQAEAGGAELENTEKVVAIQAEQIGRLDTRVQKLEEKVYKMEVIIDQKNIEIENNRLVIRQAYRCSVAPENCPVLQKNEALKALRKERHKAETQQ